jgi:hypothetical protein
MLVDLLLESTNLNSDIGGRKWVYVGSIFVFGLVNIVGSYKHVEGIPNSM